MKSLLQSEYLSVMEAKTKEELRMHVVRFANGLGFQIATAMVVIDHCLGNSEFIWVDNAPEAYKEISASLEGGRRDPVMQHCKHKSTPLVWDQSTYVTAGQAELWEVQASFGYRSGICLAMHMPKGRHFVLGVDREQPLPTDSAEITRMTAALQLFAVHAQGVAEQLLAPARAAMEAPSLTRRELEALSWTMEGKTAWEVGRILGIAEDTVVRHTQSASRKLECTSKHHAVVKALRLGLIH